MRVSDPIRFVLRCAAFLPLVLAIPLTNWIARQPAAQAVLLRDFDGMAEALLAGRTVFANVDARATKIALLRRGSRAQVLILGSSRAHQISPDWFRPRSAVNAAVNLGGIDDAVAYFELCLEAGKLPDFVLLEMNPTLMGGDVEDKDWGAMAPYLDRASARYRLSYPWSRRISELASLHQFSSNLVAFKGPHWLTTTPGVIETASVRPGGQIVFPPSAQPTDISIAAALATPYRNRTQSRPGEFELQLFHSFLDELQSRHIRVAVYLAPVHPLAYEYYAKRGGYDDRWIRREMSARGIPVAGSFSPAMAGATGYDFFDEIHPRAAVTKRLLEEAGLIEGSANPQRAAGTKFLADR